MESGEGDIRAGEDQNSADRQMSNLNEDLRDASTESIRSGESDEESTEGLSEERTPTNTENVSEGDGSDRAGLQENSDNDAEDRNEGDTEGGRADESTPGDIENGQSQQSPTNTEDWIEKLENWVGEVFLPNLFLMFRTSTDKDRQQNSASASASTESIDGESTEGPSEERTPTNTENASKGDGSDRAGLQENSDSDAEDRNDERENTSGYTSRHTPFRIEGIDILKEEERRLRGDGDKR